MGYKFRPIGIVHSPFKKKEDVSLERYCRVDGFDDVKGEVEIFPEFEQGLQDIDGFSHLILLFAFHQSKEAKLYAHPPYDDKKRGVFSTRSPHRPNPLGMTVVKLHQRVGNKLKVSGIDILDKSPLLDIKPYTPRDQKIDTTFGWIEKRKS